MHPAIKYAEQICYSSKEVLHFTYEMSKKYADKPGVYVECGVAAGAQIIAMAAVAPNKTIYAFDSFEGIPLPSNKDNQMPGIKFLTEAEQKALPNPGEQELKSSGATSVSFEDFLNHMDKSIGVEMCTSSSSQMMVGLKNNARIIALKGWFEEVLPDMTAIKEISILRLDGDLYNSTYVCLKYLYPKVIKGGLVIIDDWALPGCKAAVLDYFEGILPETSNLLFKKNEYTIAYWTK
jgi:hypothetical protein